VCVFLTSRGWATASPARGCGSMGEKDWSGCSCLKRTTGLYADAEVTGGGKTERRRSILRSRRLVSCRLRSAPTMARLGRGRQFVTHACVERRGLVGRRWSWRGCVLVPFASTHVGYQPASCPLRGDGEWRAELMAHASSRCAYKRRVLVKYVLNGSRKARNTALRLVSRNTFFFSLRREMTKATTGKFTTNQIQKESPSLSSSFVCD